MMHCDTMIYLLALIMQAHATYLAVNRTGDVKDSIDKLATKLVQNSVDKLTDKSVVQVQDSMDKLTNKLVDNLEDNLVRRLLIGSYGWKNLDSTDLDHTIPGKPALQPGQRRSEYCVSCEELLENSSPATPARALTAVHDLIKPKDMRCFLQTTISSRTPYSKEMALLAHVFATAKPGQPLTIITAIEQYGEGVLGGTGNWLKVAGGGKADVLTQCMKMGPSAPGAIILEVGCYCGFSSTQMAVACPGVKIMTLEADPAHAIIAKNVHAFGGLDDQIEVCIGHSKDLLYRLHIKDQGLKLYNMRAHQIYEDKKGRKYYEDLETPDTVGLVGPSRVLIRNNALLWPFGPDPEKSIPETAPA